MKYFRRTRNISPASQNRQPSKRRRARRSFIFLIVLIACIGAAFASEAIFSNKSASTKVSAQEQDVDNDLQISESAMQQIQALIAEKETRTATERKVDSQLLYAIRMERGEPVAANVQTLAVNVQSDSDGRLVVDIIADVTDSLLDGLRANGAEIIVSIPRFRSVRAEVSLDKVLDIAAFPEVYFIREKIVATTSQAESPRPSSPLSLPVSDDVVVSPEFAARAARVRAQLLKALGQEGLQSLPATDIGTRNSEGDVTHKARDARNTYGFDGTGIKIGVLSDGVTTLIGAQKSGDLGQVTVLPGQAGSGDEGTAMLEIIHDLAPGAQLYFATAFSGPASFAQNILDLRAAGCHIIVDDVSYTNETPFQDGQAPSIVSDTLGGIITQAVNDVTASGALFFSSAGNSGNKNDNTSGVWEGDFLDGGPLALLPGGASAGTVHDFDSVTAGTQSNQITVVTGLQYNLFWSDPLGGSNNDYDLFILNSASTAVLASSTNIQDGKQDPWEFINPGAAAGSRFVIRKATGAQNRFLHLTTNRGRLAINTNGIIRGHCISTDAYAVAATPAGPTGGTNPNGPFPGPFTAANNQVESFSSDGPRRIFFNPSGAAYTPGNFSTTGGIVRQKPDITAADGVSVTGANNFASVFYGTSAAAPHAAAIAGLLKSASPGSSPAQIRTALNSSAIDMEAPGVDRDSGVGNIMALEAMQALIGAAATAANLEFQSASATETGGNGNIFVEPGENGQLTVSLVNSGTAAATNITATLATSTPGVTISDATAAYPNIAPAGNASNADPLVFALDSSLNCLTHIEFTLTVNYSGGPSPRVFSFTIDTGQMAVIQTTLDAIAPPSGGNYVASTGTQTNRLFRTAPASSCSFTKPNPGLSAATNPRYDRYQFTNTSATQSICVSVNLAYNASIFTQNQLQSVSFSPAFLPATASTNYVGDAGATVNVQEYSFKVAPNTTFDVVVNDPLPGNPATGLGMAYTLRVNGLACAAAPANQPPVNTVPGPQVTNEDTPLVFSSGNGNQISVADPDAASNPLQVTLTATNGTITLSTTTGLTFSTGDGTADPTMTFTGTATSINNALNGLTFTTPANYNGPASLQIVTNDQGFTGSGGPLSDSDTVPITFNAVNDGPVNTVPGAQSTNENTPLVFSSGNGNQILIADVDAGSNEMQVTLTATNGTITLSTTTGLTFSTGDGTADPTMTFTGTATNINNALNGMSFNPTSGYNGPASLSITTNDQGFTGSGGALSDTDIIAITVNEGGTVQFSSATYTVNETDVTAVITVTRTGGSAGTTTVNYATSDGSATNPADYLQSSGTLTFNNGETSKTFNVTLVNDTLDEPSETVNLTLSNVTGTGALGSPNTATLTLLDDDQPALLSIGDATVNEGDSGTTNADFTVTLSPASGQVVTVNVATANGTASAPGDYTPINLTLTFNPGETTKTMTVAVVGDNVFEPSETFFVNLSAASNAVIGDGQGLGTILNNDSPATVQLSSATYTVNENAGKLTINVTRSGDPSVAGTVDYATNDGFGLAGCNVVNGMASERCDYNTTLGTLSFLAGESSKSFDIFITNDAYIEGNESFTVALTNPSNMALGAITTATATITDNDSAAAPNPIDDVQFFVRQLYIDFLSREPDATGFQNWVNTIQNCPNGGFGLNNPQCDRVRVASGFYPSVEFGERGYFIYRFYDATLGRLPQYREFIRDLQQVGGSQSPAQSEASKQLFIADFMASAEFQALYGGLTDAAHAADFVSRLEAEAGVQLPEPQRSTLIGQMQSGQKTAAQVLREFVESQVVFNNFVNRGFVTMLYFGFQRRDPDGGGFQNWLNQINQTGDARPIVFGFIYSPEYRSRFGQP
jgi:hypothetical protein